MYLPHVSLFATRVCMCVSKLDKGEGHCVPAARVTWSKFPPRGISTQQSSSCVCSFLSLISLHVAHVLYRTSLCSLVFGCSPISLNPSLDWPPIHRTHCNQLNINAIPTSGIWCLQILMQFLQVFGGISRSSLYQASVAKALRSIS